MKSCITLHFGFEDDFEGRNFPTGDQEHQFNSVETVALDTDAQRVCDIELEEIAVHHEVSGKVAMEQMEGLQQTTYYRREVLGDNEVDWGALGARISARHNKGASGKTVGQDISQLNVAVSPAGVSRPPSPAESIETVSTAVTEPDDARYEIQDVSKWFK
jgi:hypothetical protein